MVLRLLFVTGLLGLFFFSVHAQVRSPVCPYSKVTETHLVESWWQYRHTIHVGSNSIVHQGLDAYPSFIHFKFDNTAEVSTTGSHSIYPWKLDRGALYFMYRTDSIYCIFQPDPATLHLSYQTGERREQYVYVFTKVEPRATPFERPWYELPTVLVTRDKKVIDPSQKKIPWWAFWRRWLPQDKQEGPPPIRIHIEVSGGGYYGGINPVYRQYVKINSEGRLLREVQTAREGLMVTRKDIPRYELEAFAYWIRDQGYFDLQREYDCQEQLCHRRKGEKPQPMPLQVMVTLGHQTKIISIPIWGLDNQHIQYIPYPPVIDQIVETVYRMADRS